MDTTVRSSADSDSEATVSARRNSRLERKPEEEAESSLIDQIGVPTLADESDREDDCGNETAHQDELVVGTNRFEVLTDLEEEPVNRYQYTEAEVEERLVPLGVVDFDFPPTINWDPEIVGVPTQSSEGTVLGMLNSCGLEDSRITFVIPGPDNRPWNPPRGYICLYEAYFRQCRLWFSIPSLLIGYIHHHKLAISQLKPVAICNFVAALVFGAEEGYRVNVDCFEELTILKANKSSGTWVVNNRPPFLRAGSKVSNFKSWESCYFYVRIDLHSSERPLSGRRRMWNDDPGRPLNSWPSPHSQPSFPCRVRRGYVGHLPCSRLNLEGRHARPSCSYNGQGEKELCQLRGEVGEFAASTSSSSGRGLYCLGPARTLELIWDLMEQEGTNTTLELDLGSSWREMKSFKTDQEQARRSMRGRVRREEAEEELSRHTVSTTRRVGRPGAISEEGLSRRGWLDVTSRQSPPTLYFVL
ncbi:hypothetical protein ISN44_As11g029490 [Arabidopsis suecica]|uniref:Uncharacterized protein n=1 Tax=Arabidopsis suecica TaxID=45249 RepID=A0A8T1ZFQ5_ARASU|nr:hypothetical protein ISN44_As11g029490 [Arabidopsis suecica]